MVDMSITFFCMWSAVLRMNWFWMHSEIYIPNNVASNSWVHTQQLENIRTQLANTPTLGGAKPMTGLLRSGRRLPASVPKRNGGRVDKRIRLESGRLKRPGGSNPSRSASTLSHHSSVLF